MGLTSNNFANEIDIAQRCKGCGEVFSIAVKRPLKESTIYNVVCPYCKYQWEYKEYVIRGEAKVDEIIVTK